MFQLESQTLLLGDSDPTWGDCICTPGLHLINSQICILPKNAFYLVKLGWKVIICTRTCTQNKTNTNKHKQTNKQTHTLYCCSFFLSNFQTYSVMSYLSAFLNFAISYIPFYYIVFCKPVDVLWISQAWVANQSARKWLFTGLLHVLTVYSKYTCILNMWWLHVSTGFVTMQFLFYGHNFFIWSAFHVYNTYTTFTQCTFHCLTRYSISWPYRSLLPLTIHFMITVVELNTSTVTFGALDGAVSLNDKLSVQVNY